MSRQFSCNRWGDKSKTTLQKLFDLANKKENLDTDKKSIHIDSAGRIKCLRHLITPSKTQPLLVKESSEPATQKTNTQVTKTSEQTTLLGSETLKYYLPCIGFL